MPEAFGNTIWHIGHNLYRLSHEKNEKGYAMSCEFTALRSVSMRRCKRFLPHLQQSFAITYIPVLCENGMFDVTQLNLNTPHNLIICPLLFNNTP